MEPLTQKQNEMLEFIRNHIALAHYSPSIEEIRVMTGMKTKSHVHHHLVKLREAGYITWTPGKARTIIIQRREPHVAD